MKKNTIFYLTIFWPNGLKDIVWTTTIFIKKNVLFFIALSNRNKKIKQFSVTKNNILNL